jgi:hypothetical protein
VPDSSCDTIIPSLCFLAVCLRPCHKPLASLYHKVFAQNCVPPVRLRSSPTSKRHGSCIAHHNSRKDPLANSSPSHPSAFPKNVRPGPRLKKENAHLAHILSIKLDPSAETACGSPIDSHHARKLTQLQNATFLSTNFNNRHSKSHLDGQKKKLPTPNAPSLQLPFRSFDQLSLRT